MPIMTFGGSGMPRPSCYRTIAGRPAVSVFKPLGIPVVELEEIVMTLDEFEAIRLADLNGLYQEHAAEKMRISRSTFSRIVDVAHQKVADALVHGKALRIEGGPVHLGARRCCRHHDSESKWSKFPSRQPPGGAGHPPEKEKSR
jgi:uncharacterized protein